MSNLKVGKTGNVLNGWIPQEKDARDYQYLAIAKAVAAAKESDLRENCSPVENQGQLGSCVYNTAVGALEYLEIVNKEKFVDKSRLFAYYCARDENGTVNQDTGDTIRHSMKVLAKYGTCDEAYWPYITSKFAEKPPQMCYDDAKQHVITSYYAIKDLDGIRLCLTEGFPVCFGTYLFPQFEVVLPDGKVYMPFCFKKPIGRHAMLFVGHNDAKEILIVRNSWGKLWGDKGYCYIPYKYIQKYASDFWTIRVEK